MVYWAYGIGANRAEAIVRIEEKQEGFQSFVFLSTNGRCEIGYVVSNDAK